MNRRITLSIVLIMSFFIVSAQSDQIELGSKQYDFIDRLEVLLRTDSTLNMSSFKPLNRKDITQKALLIKQQSDKGLIQLSKVDKYNLDQLLKDNFEWSYSIADTSAPFANLFNKNGAQTPFYWGTKKEDFSFFLKPIIGFEMGKENNVTHSLLRNSRGFEVRGTVGNVGYYSTLTDNQEIFPLYVQKVKDAMHVVPGTGNYKNYRDGGGDYWDVKGGISFKAGKHIDVQFASDKIFVGDGFRSLILSDNSDNFLFLKVRTSYKRFQFYNLYAQLTTTSKNFDDLHILPQKNMVMQYLDYQISKKVNIAIFENVMFNRSSGNFDLNYLNPVIFLDGTQSKLGSPDKLTVGMNIKANILKKTQIYGQLLINEWVTHEVTHYSNGWWGNKEALQLGIKNADFLGIKNLDVQAEANIVRPFVYTHNDTAGSYTHYNQALAHPLGANFKEFIGIIKYQPCRKFTFNTKLFYSIQGLDSAGKNFGSNIFELYTTRVRDYGFSIGDGIKSTTFTASTTISYEVIPNLFLNANMLIRNNKTDGQKDFNTTAFMFGFRWNIARREFYF